MSLKAILASILAVATISASSINVFAALDTSKTRPDPARPAWTQRRGDRFDRLLEAGVISQETVDKIKAFLENDKPQPLQEGGRWNTLDKLLEAGVITQEEYDALKTAMQKPGQRPEGLGRSASANPFARFAADGTITQETADAIWAYLTENKPQKTKESPKTGVLDRMLEAGVITQDEYDAINAAFPQQRERAGVAAAR